MINYCYRFEYAMRVAKEQEAMEKSAEEPAEKKEPSL
jgi:hypothetical protein